MKFPLPSGFEPPPDTEVGGTFEAVATLTLNEDGSLTLNEIDGAEVEKVKDKPKPKEDDGDMYSRMKKAMAGKS